MRNGDGDDGGTRDGHGDANGNNEILNAIQTSHDLRGGLKRETQQCLAVHERRDVQAARFPRYHSVDPPPPRYSMHQTVAKKSTKATPCSPLTRPCGAAGRAAGTVLLNSAGAMNNKGVVGDWRIVLVYPIFLLIDLLLSIRPVAAYLFDRCVARWCCLSDFFL